MAADTRTFIEYLTTMVETGEAAERDDPVGDFAIDSDCDSFFPRGARADAEGFITVVNYLYFNRGVWDRVLDAFMDAWLEYYKTITGEDWVEEGYIKFIR